MSPAHIHLMLNHVPVIGLLFAMLLLVYGLARKSTEVARASFLMYVLVALATIAVYFSGRGAEDIVENLPEVSEAMMAMHEDAALVSLTAILIVGVAALAGFIFVRSKPISRKLAVLVLVLSLLAGLSVGYTGSLGGKIHHPELRPGFVPPPERSQPHESRLPSGSRVHDAVE
ncbi:MAG: hypothetical protein V1784_05360 [bacterium]